MRNKMGGENKGMRNKRGGEVDSVRGSLSVHSGALLRLSTPLGGCQGAREGGRGVLKQPSPPSPGASFPPPAPAAEQPPLQTIPSQHSHAPPITEAHLQKLTNQIGRSTYMHKMCTIYIIIYAHDLILES